MILQLANGLLGSNCYLILDTVSGEGAIIDPGLVNPAPVVEEIRTRGIEIRYILNTHGHFDHVAGNGTLQFPDARLGIHPHDRELLLTGGGSAMFGLDMTPSPAPDIDLDDNMSLTLGITQIAVLHTPGHTPGSVCLYVTPDNGLLTGDTLFKNSVGRTDLPGGSARALTQSLRRIIEFTPITKLYPGHGPLTTLSQEMTHNPWLQNLAQAPSSAQQ